MNNTNTGKPFNKVHISCRVLLHTILLLSFFSLSAHNKPLRNDLDSNQYKVQYVAQFPDSEVNNEDFTSKLGRIVFGKKPKMIKKPISVIADSPAHFWILDQGNGLVFEKQFDTGEIPAQINKNDILFQSLVDLCFLPGEEILFSDSKLNKIFRMSSDEKNLKTIGDSLYLQQPTGIAYCNQTGEIWVMETAAHRVTVVNKQGELIKRIGERGKNPGQFNFPTHIWIDNSGKAYIVDAMNFRVQIFDSKGDFLMEFGEAGDATGFFASPKGIATDTQGNIYVADALFHVIQIFDKNGDFLYYFGSQGRGKGEFWMPAGIFIDSNNYIYVADSYNSRIQIFKLISDN